MSKTNQTTMFATEDLPLFSGTPVNAKQEEAGQYLWVVIATTEDGIIHENAIVSDYRIALELARLMALIYGKNHVNILMNRINELPANILAAKKASDAGNNVDDRYNDINWAMELMP
jgi:hypothetical protein